MPVVAFRDVATWGRRNPACIGCFIAIAALAFRVWVAIRYHDETIGHLVKGVPVSDGSSWDAMSVDFAFGDRASGLWNTYFDAIRPFRWIFMGAVYALTGPAVAVTQAVHVILGALSAVFLFEAMRRLAPLPVAIASASYQAFSLVDARFALTTACEPLGGFLSVLFLLVFVLAARALCESGRQGRTIFLWLAAGVVLGLASLTRPEIMAVTVLMPAALLLWLSRRSQPRPGSRRLGKAGLLLVAGFAVVMGPWLLRQRVKHGIWAVSANAGDLLFAASSPRYRAWQPEVPALVEGMSIHDRTAFFNAGVRQHLRENPLFYVRNAAEHGARVARGLLRRTPLLLALLFVVLYMLALARDRRRLASIIAVGSVLAASLWLIPEAHLYWLWLIGLALAMVRRAPMLVIGAFLASPILLLGMTAMSGDLRLLYALEVPAFALAVWLLACMLEPLGAEAPAGWPDRQLQGWGRAGRVALKLGIVAVLVLALGAGKALWAARAPHAPRGPSAVAGDEAAAWIASALDAPEALPYVPFRSRLEVRTAVLRSDYRMHFRAGESVMHWNPLFRNPRRYAFTVAEMRPSRFEPKPLPGPERYAVLPDGIEAPDGQRLVLVGLRVERPAEGTSLEVIAVAREEAGLRGSISRPSAGVARAHAIDVAAARPADPSP